MSSSISLLQLPRLCIWTGKEEDGPVLSGVGPYLELYRPESGEYRLESRTKVFGASGRPITAIRSLANRKDAFVIVGSSMLCILMESELNDPVVPSSRIFSFNDEIVNIAIALQLGEQYEFGLVFRSGLTLLVNATIDDTNQLKVTTAYDYDNARCGVLMSALCLIPDEYSEDRWDDLRCIAGSAMGQVRLWGTDESVSSSATTECGNIGFVISMAVVDECHERSEATVLAVTENRAMNMWRIQYRDSNWLQLLQTEVAAHSVRPSALAYCNWQETAVSAAEDGEMCIWSVSQNGFTLFRRFQTRIGAVRSLRIDHDGHVLYGSMTGSLFSVPLDSLVALPLKEFMGGYKLFDSEEETDDGDCNPAPIRSFAVVYEQQITPPFTRTTELQCLGEDGSMLDVLGEAVELVSKWNDKERHLHLASWTDRDCAITVFYDDKKMRVNIYDPQDHLKWDQNGFRCLKVREAWHIIAIRPTMSRTEKGTEAYLVVQTAGGEIAVLLACRDGIRLWRYRIPMEDVVGGKKETKKKRQNEMLIVNSVAIDRSTDTELHVVLGTTNGRLMYAPMKGEGHKMSRADLEPAKEYDGSVPNLILYPRSPRLEKTSITQLEYCRERRECTALSKNGWMMRLRIDGRNGLMVSYEEISRELGVEWPVRIERRGEEEYVIGFNSRNLVVVSRRLKTCLMSIDCGGGHRQVHVDLDRKRDECGKEVGEVNRIVVYYGKNAGIVRHSQESLIAGLRQLAWTPHRDKIVFCTGVERYVLMGSIDGEIVLGTRNDDSLSVLQRWYVPETTTACVMKRYELIMKREGNDILSFRLKNMLRVVIGGPKGYLFVVDWSEENSASPLTKVSTHNDSRIIDVCVVGEHVVAAFANAQIAIFKMDSSLGGRRVAVWEMPLKYKSMFTKICVTQSEVDHKSLFIIDAITSAGTLTRLEYDTMSEKMDHIVDISIDSAALTVIRRDPASGKTIIGSDSGAIFEYYPCTSIDENSQKNILVLSGVWRDAHCCQITDLDLFYSSSGKLCVASVGMDCIITVFEMPSGKDQSIVRRSIFAVNDPSSIMVLSASVENMEVLVAGCGLEIVHL